MEAVIDSASRAVELIGFERTLILLIVLALLGHFLRTHVQKTKTTPNPTPAPTVPFICSFDASHQELAFRRATDPILAEIRRVHEGVIAINRKVD